MFQKVGEIGEYYRQVGQGRLVGRESRRALAAEERERERERHPVTEGTLVSRLVPVMWVCPW